MFDVRSLFDQVEILSGNREGKRGGSGYVSSLAEGQREKRKQERGEGAK